MLSIFKKKYFLADFLEGLTDMHCHLLPGVDDGAADYTISEQMMKEYVALGYVGAIATPHIMDGLYYNDSQKLKQVLTHFTQQKSNSEFKGFKVEVAAEYMLDQGFDGLLDNRDFLPVKDKKVLIEMSYFQRNIYVETQIFNLQGLGFQPILAHPERYVYLNKPEKVLEFQTKGCDLQLNMLSLSEHYGRAVQKQSHYLLLNDHYDFMGTDAHRPDHLKKIKEITLSKKMIPAIESLAERTKNRFSN